MLIQATQAMCHFLDKFLAQMKITIKHAHVHLGFSIIANL